MPSDAEATAQLRVDVLGPLRLVVDGEPIDVPGPKRRTVLALLAMAAGRAVAVDDLLDAVWPSDPADAARATLQSHISRLRGHLGPAAARLETVGGGYRLDLEPGALDAQAAAHALSEARAMSPTDPRAAAMLRDARARWRGPELADLTEVLPLAAWVTALGELRHEIDELLVERAVAIGDAASIVGIAVATVADAPLREPAVLALMRALAATGRGAEALRAGHEFRRRLVDETGLDPSSELDDLERQIASGPSGTSRTRVSIPAAAAPLVGRDAEVAALSRLLDRDPLVTVVGPGGVGKTRLALEVARRSEGVCLLTLAPVTDPDAVPYALAGALQLETVRGDVLGACTALLATGPRLLVVDNCEHLLDAAREIVTTLLGSCPELTVLATSREPLGFSVEQQFRLAPLPLPGPAAELARAPAVTVFVDRARRVRPDFVPSPDDLALVADIVRRLDGMPLAIELAAGRLSSFALADLHDGIDDALDLLGDGRTAADARHRTLRTTVAWSYDLLPEDAQRLFRHLSVFPDGVDLPTAERVAAELDLPGATGATLARLVDASMVEADFTGGSRYRMLETLRSFGLDRLDAMDERVAAEDRLVRWAITRAHEIDRTVNTPDEKRADAALRREFPNLRAAWRLVRRRGDLDNAIDLVVTLDEFSQMRDLPEVWRWAQELADDVSLTDHSRAGAALAAAAGDAWMLGDVTRAKQLAVAGLRSVDDEDRWRALISAAVCELSDARYEETIARILEAIAIAPRPSHLNWMVAMAAAYAGDLGRARAYNEIGTGEGDSVRAQHEYVEGEIEGLAGRYAEAEHHYIRAIELARGIGATFLVGVASVGLFAAQMEAGRHEAALRGYRELIDYWERAGNWVQMWTTMRNLAELLRRLGDPAAAHFLEAAADHAPDAPAVGAAAVATRATVAGAGRAESLARARAAIEAQLRQS